jgi:hypothetical protein
MNFRMNADEKEEWREYADKSRWNDNLSDFIKKAVREKIERMDTENETFEIPEVNVDQPDGKTKEQIQNLRNDIQQLADGVSEAVDAVHAQEGIDPELAPELFDHLPTGEENAIEAAEMQTKTGFSMAKVRFGLENLARNMKGVIKKPQTIVVDDDPDPVYRDGIQVNEEQEVGTVEGEPLWYKREGI